MAHAARADAARIPHPFPRRLPRWPPRAAATRPTDGAQEAPRQAADFQRQSPNRRIVMATSLATLSQNQPPAQVDLSVLKTRQHGAWSSGDYAVVGTTLQIVGEQLCETLDVRAGQ